MSLARRVIIALLRGRRGHLGHRHDRPGIEV